MRASHLNFIAQAKPSGLWRWLLCLAGLLALGLWWRQAWQQQQINQALQQQLATIQPAPKPMPQRSASEQRELQAQAKIISAAVRQLNLPLAELLRTVQAPKDIRVSLLGLDLNAKGGSQGLIKIQAETHSTAEMMNYVAFLDEQRWLQSVYLVKHEMPGVGNDAVVRFVVEAQWRP
ncbi:MAG: hypothetical protein RL748_932 [Pseudomonadota bacterium]|jgi:cytoskeletal protein RodZ